MPQILGQPYNTGSFACDIICLNQRARRALWGGEGGGGGGVEFIRRMMSN